MFGPLRNAFRAVVKEGDLRITDAGGRTHRFGDGTGPVSAVRIVGRWTEFKTAFDPWLAIPEAYMDGRLIVEKGDLYGFIDMILRNAGGVRQPYWTHGLTVIRWLVRRIDQFNPVARARRNASAHYDIDPEIYRLFLDEDMQYSCAYFESPGDDLETAQRAKKRHLAAKMLVRPGDKVLDIGSGWGGLALYLARVTGAEVTGITLSSEQLKSAKEQAGKAPKADRVSFRLQDYRNTQGRFDRIVSVGMFEHVGVGHYRVFFRKIASLLGEDGIALLHSIGRSDGPHPTNPFIKKYIFPGGSLPALSEVLPCIEDAGLKVCDIEILRLHYAETLRHWRERFLARWDDVARLKGEKFCRMWEFYLVGCEASFRHQNLMVFQIQMARSLTAVPLTRNYIHEEEKRLAECERFGDGKDVPEAPAPRKEAESG